MKKRTSKLLSLLLTLTMVLGMLPAMSQVAYAAGDVEINAANFPDANFRDFVKTYDKDSNGYLSEAELAAVTEMDCHSKDIADLTGIEHFTALTVLDCYNNQLTTLDVSKNTNLKWLYCYGNNLTTLDVSANIALTYLWCYTNKLTTLDVSKNTNLKWLDCYGNNLTTLDVSAVPALKDAKENGTYTSGSVYDVYSSMQGALAVDKTVNIITEHYTISFAANGGTGTMADVTGISGEYTLPANGFTAPAGKQFKGWSEEPNGEVISETTIHVSEDTTLYAIWEDVTFTSTADFTSGDGTAALDLLNTYKTGEADSTWDADSKTLTLNGVNFTTTNPTAVKLPAGATIVLNGENTIKGGNSDSANSYGIWGAGDLTIQDGLEEGTGTLTVTGGNTGSTYDSFGIYTDDGDINITGGTVNATGGTAGYNSCGIFLKGSSGSVNISGGIVTATGGTAIHISYGIFLRGSSGSVNISGGTVIAEANDFALIKQPTLPAAYSWRTSDSNDYSEFPGTAYEWSSSHSYSHSYVEIKSNPTYTVSFNANGGTGTMEDVTGISGAYDLPANGFTAPAGKQFKAWSVGGVEKAVGDKITVTADTTVTAVWENIPVTYYTVTFDSNGGSAVTAQTVEAGQKATKPADPTKSGYDFKGWTLNGSAYDFNTAVNGNITLVATWEAKQVVPTTYTVSFVANGGTGSMADVTGISGEYTLPANGFTAPEGKQFKAWSVGGVEKAVGDKITVTADTTVTAVWETIPAGHTCDIKPVAKVEPSCTEGGKEAYYKCEGCGKFYEDALGVKEITDLAAWGNIAKNGHTESDWKSDKDNHWKECTVAACGVIIENSKAAHADTNNDGKCDTCEYNVGTTTTNPDNKPNDNPQTGDNSNMFLWIALLFVSGAGVVATTVFGKKRFSVK